MEISLSPKEMKIGLIKVHIQTCTEPFFRTVQRLMQPKCVSMINAQVKCGVVIQWSSWTKTSNKALTVHYMDNLEQGKPDVQVHVYKPYTTFTAVRSMRTKGRFVVA